MKELRATSNSDSGQSSEEEDGQTDKWERKTCGDVKRPQMNGSSAGGRLFSGRNSKDDDEDEPLDPEQSAGDEDVASVLQVEPSSRHVCRLKSPSLGS